MNDTLYFSHNYNARLDEKIKPLIRKHGMTGYGVFWAIIEDLYNNANALQTDCERIAYELRTDEKTVKSIINDFKLFEIKGDFFSSPSVAERLKIKVEKSTKARESAQNRWGKNANAMRTQCERIANASKNHANKEINKKDLFLNNEEQKSFPASPEGAGSDFLTKRKECYKKHLAENQRHPAIQGYTWFVDYICNHDSPILSMKTLTISQFSQVNSKTSRHDKTVSEIMCQFDKKFKDFAKCEDAFNALTKFTEIYYPKVPFQ